MKSTRKPSAAQRDKQVKELAIKLKKAGILSKQAKLNRSYVSRDVLRKVKQYQDAAFLNYKAVKVSKKVAAAAKERGYQVVGGNKIIGPSTKQFKKRLASGQLSGVKPVKGGYMEEVVLPHDVVDLYTLMLQLEKGIDTYKMPDEYFAFKYQGNESRRTMRDSQELLNYLRNYKGIMAGIESMKPEDLQEEFDALTIFRLHPSTERLNIPTDKQREQRRRQRELDNAKQGIFKQRGKRKGRLEKAAKMSDYAAERYLEKLRKKDAEKREKLKRDPKRYEEVLRKQRERQRALRAKKN